MSLARVIIAFYFILAISIVCKAQCPEPVHPDYDALMALYNSTQGVNWSANTGWVDGVMGINCDPCDGSWYGIECNELGRVESINFWQQNLSGSLPQEIGNLNHLKELKFFQAGLSGIIPSEISNLSLLETLYIRSNYISGIIPPELSQLTNLKELILLDNNLSGSIPSTFGQFENIEYLDLGFNELTGQLPIELTQTNNLQYLSLHRNNLDGPIPAEFGDLNNLTSLNLGSNNFTGEIPVELSQLNNLTSLNLSRNNLLGELPSEIGLLPNLTGFSASHNNLSGCIPDSYTQLCLYIMYPYDFITIGFDYNQYLPYNGDFFSYCNNIDPNIEETYVPCNTTHPDSALYEIDENCQCIEVEEINCLSPKHPDFDALMDLYHSTNGKYWKRNKGWLEASYGINCDPCDGNWTGIGCLQNRVNAIFLANNNLTGTLPESLSQIESLEYIELSDNALTGTIPESVFYLPNLIDIEIRRNMLEQISINNPISKSIKSVHLPRNKISGKVPTYLLNDNKIETLYLSFNNFDNSIDFYEDNSELSILSLSNNSLTGNIPANIFSAKKLQSLFLDNNQFSGELTINNISNSFRKISLSNNQLSGSIPKNLIGAIQLESLNLNHNNFTVLPDSLNAIYLDISSNNLSGCFSNYYDMYCDSGKTLIIDDNPNLPWAGDFLTYCNIENNAPTQAGAPCGENLNKYIQYDCTCEDKPAEIPFESENIFNINYNQLSNNFEVSLIYEFNAEFIATIYNVNGQRMTQHFALSNQHITNVPVGDWENGIYIVTISSEFGFHSYKFTRF